LKMRYGATQNGAVMTQTTVLAMPRRHTP
jgi:hypothetical protein